MKNIYTLIFIAFTFLMVFGCANQGQEIRNRATRNLQGRGYTNIQFTGNSTGICEYDDIFDLEFTATKKDGSAVSGSACAENYNDIEIEFRD